MYTYVSKNVNSFEFSTSPNLKIMSHFVNPLVSISTWKVMVCMDTFSLYDTKAIVEQCHKIKELL